MTAVPQQYAGDVKWAAGQLRLPVSVVAAQINDESGFNPGATSPTNAQGIAQFEPGTWAGLGCAGSPYDAAASFKCYVKYMHQLLTAYHGDVRKALAAYNAGPANLQAGYAYADSILRAAGQSPGLTTARTGTGQASSGSSSSGNVTLAASVSDPAACAWTFGGIPTSFGNIGQFCVISKSQLRAVLGGLFLGMGLLGMTSGVSLIAAAAALPALEAGAAAISPIGRARALPGRYRAAAGGGSSSGGRGGDGGGGESPPPTPEETGRRVRREYLAARRSDRVNTGYGTRPRRKTDAPPAA